jgi:hypothetical protein
MEEFFMGAGIVPVLTVTPGDGTRTMRFLVRRREPEGTLSKVSQTVQIAG